MFRLILFLFITFIASFFISFTMSFSAYCGINDIGNVFHYSYDPFNDTFIVPSMTKHQIFIFNLNTLNIWPIVGTDGITGVNTNVPGN